jgi:hypothetical protein
VLVFFYEDIVSSFTVHPITAGLGGGLLTYEIWIFQRSALAR